MGEPGGGTAASNNLIRIRQHTSVPSAGTAVLKSWVSFNTPFQADFVISFWVACGTPAHTAVGSSTFRGTWGGVHSPVSMYSASFNALTGLDGSSSTGNVCLPHLTTMLTITGKRYGGFETQLFLCPCVVCHNNEALAKLIWLFICTVSVQKVVRNRGPAQPYSGPLAKLAVRVFTCVCAEYCVC